jgi:16S rRNA (cytosine1402-N4)-methyltransferase
LEGVAHIPVLREEVVRVLVPRAGEVYVDCTAGRGGHASAVAVAMRAGTLILNDADAANLEFAVGRVRTEASGVSVTGVHGNFAMLPRELEKRGIRANMILADLGFSSNQIEEPSRGFSFSRPGALDMRFDPSRGLSAGDLVNQASEKELEGLIREFGEDPQASRIARAIVSARATGVITSTDRLAEIVRGACGRAPGQGGPGIDPATRTFQALRIAVNDEIGSLGALLAGVVKVAEKLRPGASSPPEGRRVSGDPEMDARPTGSGVGNVGLGGLWLAEGARIGVITFHSLEDRPVKRVFADICRRELAVDLTPGGWAASDEEIRRNPRSRSARLRAIRVGSGGAG